MISIEHQLGPWRLKKFYGRAHSVRMQSMHPVTCLHVKLFNILLNSLIKRFLRHTPLRAKIFELLGRKHDAAKGAAVGLFMTVINFS